MSARISRPPSNQLLEPVSHRSAMGSWIIYLPVDDRTGWKLSGKAGKLRKVPAKFLPIAAHDDRLTRPVSAEQAAIAVELWLVGPRAVTEISLGDCLSGWVQVGHWLERVYRGLSSAT